MFSTLRMVLGGELTVERARRKMYERARSNLRSEADLLGHVLDPRRYLFIADAEQSEEGVYYGRVVRTSERPFNGGGAKSNWDRIVKHR